MNWLFLIIGVVIGFLISKIAVTIYLASRIYGNMYVDKSRENKFIFRLEFTADPERISYNNKYIMFRIKKANLNEVKTDDFD